MENITFPTVIIVGVLIGLFFLVTRNKGQLFGSGNAKRSDKRQSRGALSELGNSIGEQFSAGSLGEFEGTRRIK